MVQKNKQKVSERTLLFEIGVEELPAAFIEHGRKLLAESAEKILKEEGQLEYQRLHTHGTPRRLMLCVEGIREKPLEKDEILGPMLKASYDSEGKPTTALKGFVENRGATLKDVYTKESPKGPRVALNLIRPRMTLAICLELICAQLSFPKMMRWIGTRGSGFTFPRPVRWILALENSKVIRVKLGTVQSGRFTYGHRFLAPERISIKRANFLEYKSVLRRKHVWLEQKEREACIEKSLEKLSAHNSDRDLIETVASLVEEPFAAEGHFRKEFMQLPAEVLATCMAKNQKIFACFDKHGNATGRFVAFLNGKRSKLKDIVHGYERVLSARLTDAGLFFKEDQEVPLASRREQLKQLVFLGKLGTIFDKTERVGKLGALLLKDSPQPDLSDRLVEAARLSKADLSTQMVYEFPELQGVIGAVYALTQGADAEVARAIRDHYWPKSLRETMDVKKPIGVLGAWLGVADRIDTLVGAFGMGVELSGSQDPYALRRAAGGVVKIVFEMNQLGISRLDFSLSHSFAAAYKGYGHLKVGEGEVQTKLLEVFRERLVSELWDGQDQRLREILDGVLNTSADKILVAIEKYQHLKTLYTRHRKILAQACKVVERTHNILKGSKQPVEDQVTDSLLEQGVEQSLYSKFKGSQERIRKLVEAREYGDATRAYAEDFYQIIHKYFDEVLVNVEDAAVRKNRHALMKKVNELYTANVADLSCVTQVEDS